ncbi:MAG: DUF3795 domain-containing protein [Ignavibacteriales bacterium]
MGFNFDSYCGIYCGACSIMVSYRTGEKDPLANFFNEENVRSFLAMEGHAYPEGEPFEHKCEGCKTNTLFINCRPCQIRACAQEKKVEHCVECRAYPCPLFEARMCNPQIQQNLPHSKMPVINLDRIKEVGFDQWLTEQEAAWSCPDCGNSFSWYAAVCSKCGRELNSLKDYSKL